MTRIVRNLLAIALGIATFFVIRLWAPDVRAQKAYIWGYPLIAMERSRDLFTQEGGTPLNTFKRYDKLITPEFKEVVTPNVDTLYSIAWLDLDKPLVLSVPDTADRYYVIQFLDAYTNVFKNIGKRTTGTKAGTYLIVPPGWEGAAPQDMEVIKAPTTMVWLITRILVKNEADAPKARTILNAITLKPLDGSLGKRFSQAPVGAPQDIADAGIGFFDELSAALVKNTIPESERARVASFKKIGVGPGKVPSKNITDEKQRNLLIKGIKAAEKAIDKKIVSMGTTYNTSWLTNLDLGRYGTDYLLRAAISKQGLGANVPEESVYSLAYVDREGDPLLGEHAYVVHFSELPPVDAFWSLTMYDSRTKLLVPNDQNRYAISDRSEVTYNDDGSLDVYVQQSKPENATNWLPAPDGKFYLVLRMYMPKETILDGTYNYPEVTRVT